MCSVAAEVAGFPWECLTQARRWVVLTLGFLMKGSFTLMAFLAAQWAWQVGV